MKTYYAKVLETGSNCQFYCKSDLSAKRSVSDWLSATDFHNTVTLEIEPDFGSMFVHIATKKNGKWSKPE